MRMGVSMWHQHFKLVPSFTVAHNVMLGHEPRRGLFYDGHEAEETVRRLSAEYGLKVEPGDVVRDLSVGIQQRVEILKALRTGADVLILDDRPPSSPRRRPRSCLRSSVAWWRRRT